MIDKESSARVEFSLLWLGLKEYALNERFAIILTVALFILPLAKVMASVADWKKSSKEASALIAQRQRVQGDLRYNEAFKSIWIFLNKRSIARSLTKILVSQISAG